MKIGVVTVQDSNNFGSFLQAYAMQHVLRSMGHEVVFIRTRSEEYLKSLFYSARPGKRDLLHLPAYIRTNFSGRKKYRRFQEELKCFRVVEKYGDEKLDAVVLGSDEIWNVRTPVFRKEIFYGCGMEHVMAYAVSVGNATTEELNQWISQEWIQHISPVLSRDVHTTNYLKGLSIDSPLVCDPTFLVDREVFYRDYTDPLMDGKPYLLVYSYGLTEEIAKEICNFAREKNLRVLSACFPFSWCDGTFNCTALDFCSILKRADYVFTSTFHGTIFSVLNHKKFVSLPQSRKTSDLLNRLGLADHLITEDKCLAEQFKEKFDIFTDYEAVDQRIAQWKEESISLLKIGLVGLEKQV